MDGMSMLLGKPNNYLKFLLGESMGDQSFWTQAYDTGQYYDQIGGYSIFVANTTDGGYGGGQGFLSLYRILGILPSGGTPEPATILIWAFGLGATGYYRRRMKKLVAE